MHFWLNVFTHIIRMQPRFKKRVFVKLKFFDLKACVRYFYFFYQMIPLHKLWKLLFISSKVLFSIPFTLSRLKRTHKSGKFMVSLIVLHILAGLIFGITQKPLYMTSSNLCRKYIINEKNLLHGMAVWVIC